jgi:hypothetical protein
LSLDVLRAVYKSKGSVLQTFANEVLRRAELVKTSGNAELQSSTDKVKLSLQKTMEFAQKNATKLEVAARDFAFSLARTYMGKQMKWSYNSSIFSAVFLRLKWQQDTCI